MIAYVTEDGNYGGDRVLTFDSDSLTDAQWERVADMNDNDRLPYIQSILENDEATISQYEMED
tara:strand:- start:1272 stop:1460 length:189 start_codon:yes stop_codon:yes gene_type:complete